MQSCPSEQQLAEYADQQAIGAQRHAIEQHLAHCDKCLRQVGFLVKTASQLGEPVNPSLLQKALHSAEKAKGRIVFPWGWATVAAGALAAVLAIIVVWPASRQTQSGPSQPGRSDSETKPATPRTDQPLSSVTRIQDETNVVRGSDSTESQVLLFPQPGQEVAVRDFTIRWRAQHGAQSYAVQILSADGDIVWETRCQTPSTRVPNGILTNGRTYYVHLKMHTNRGTEQGFKTVEFVAK